MNARHVNAILLAACACACAGPDDFRPLRPGDPAPAYSAATLDEDTISLASLEGYAVLINVWATWCIPCRKEMPALQTLAHDFHDDGLRVLGVNIDTHGTNDVRHFVDEYDIRFDILRDPAGHVTRAFRTTGVPESILIDRNGRVVHRWIGAFDPLSAATLERVRTALR